MVSVEQPTSGHDGQVSATPSSQSQHANNFGLLRLFFAALVVVSHSPQLVDGNVSREPLVRTFGTMSFGEIAVDGFFLISGFLISQSFARSPSRIGFAIKRAGRILPGYLVALALCFFALAPFVGAREAVISVAGLKHFLSEAAGLYPAQVDGAFATVPYPELNSSMWTIAYEARCYIAVLLLGLTLERIGGAALLLPAFVVGALFATSLGLVPPVIKPHMGQLDQGLRFAGVFGTGALFYLYRTRIKLLGSYALVAAILLVCAMPFRVTAEPAWATLGGYLIFWAAFRLPASPVSRWTDRTDLSYGLYLYAWPIGNLLVYLNRGIDPWLLCGATILGAAACGTLSWILIEKPSMKLAHRFGGKRPANKPASMATTATA